MAKKKSSKSTKKDQEFLQLRKWNIAAGVLHFLIGTLIVILTNDYTISLITNYLKFDPETLSLVTSPEVVYDLRLGYAVALFSFFSAGAHFIISAPGVYEWYVKNLKNNINYARWYEYAFSSSLMIVLIAMLTGMYDLNSLILLFALNATMILFGYMMELHNQNRKNIDWTSFIFGCFAGIIPWLVIAMYLFGAGEGENRTPDFVYGIFFTMFIFFNSFAINMFLQYKKVGPWKDYIFGEKVYIILSFVAKTALALQVFSGTLMPN